MYIFLFSLVFICFYSTTVRHSLSEASIKYYFIIKLTDKKTVHYQIQPNFETTYIFRDFHLVHSFKGNYELKIFETIASIR